MLLKKIYTSTAVVAILASSLTLSSCGDKFLDVEPQGERPQQQTWQNQNDAIRAVSSIYANLRFWNQTAFAPMYVESMGSGDVAKGSVPGDADYMAEPITFAHTSTAGQIADFWSGQYQNVNLCNQVLTNVPAISMDEALKARLLAEAKFVRAYSYFRLVRAFGDVPLLLTLPSTPEEYNTPRSPKAEVWAAIEQDLTDAASVLPQAYPAADLGRATRGAALALHAKVSMYQAKWPQVLALTNQVMGLGYDLFPDFEKMFRVENEFSVESIFEVNAEYYPGIPDATNSQYSQVQGPRNVPGYWGFHVPNATLEAAFDAAGDVIRKNATLMYVGETTPQGDVIPASGAGGPTMYNQKAYVPFSFPFAIGPRGSQQNVRVLRFADVLLMNAEAANELDNPGQARTSLNRVRTRAGLADQTSNDKAVLRTAIWNERRLELALENDYFFDVIRQGRGPALWASRGFIAGKNELMPIPQNQILLSAGVLTQNPNY